jgi:hypothetical protein
MDGMETRKSASFAADIDILKAQLQAKEADRYALDERLDALLEYLRNYGNVDPKMLRYCRKCQAVRHESDITYVVKSRATRDESAEYFCTECESKGDQLFEEF